MKKIIFLILLSSLLGISTSFASGKIYINVGKANVKKSLLAIPPINFYGSSPNKSHLAIGQNIFTTLRNDLEVSNYFSFISQAAYLEDTKKTGLKPAPAFKSGFDFKKWKTIGTEFLIRSGYKVIGQKVELEAYVYYVPQAKLIFGKTYEGSPNSARLLAHTFANDIVKNLTGKQGMFTSKIAFVGNYGGLKNKSVFVMDWDGKNIRRVGTANTIHISPAWSKDGKKMAYTAYAYHPRAKTRNADLFTYEFLTGKRWLVSYRKGINSGANFLHDNRHMLLTISQGGNPDIFRMTVDGKSLTRLTNGPNGAMNVEPKVSPDGQHIAFSSNRSGRPMIYIMNKNGGAVRRVTFAGRYNSTPSWSPDGKRLVFSGYDKTHYDIFIVNRDGTKLERLTSARKKNGRWSNNEYPSFSPDGRHIVFASDRSGTHQLYIISPDGTNERRLTFDRYNYTTPAWSPFL